MTTPRSSGVCRVRRSAIDLCAVGGGQRPRRLRLEELEERMLLAAIPLATDRLALSVESTTGYVTRASDPTTGINYLQTAAAFARVKVGSTWYSCSSCALADNVLTFGFATSPQNNVLTLAVEQAPARDDYFVFTVESLSPLADGLRLFNFQSRLTSQYNNFSGVATDDNFALYIRSLSPAGTATVNAFIDDIAPAAHIVGAACALGGSDYGAAGAAVLGQLKTLIVDQGLLTSSLGGPWATDPSATLNQESYVFADNLSEANVQQWITLAKTAGLGIIHINSWQTSLGHYALSPTKFPNGLTGMQSVVDQIHAAGLKVGLHTLTVCIGTNDSYVTPTPDPRLGKDASFTMTADITDADTTITVNEPITGLVSTWGTYGGNVLQIDNELIQYTGYTTTTPYQFTGCTRGVFGTARAAHATTTVAHLYSSFGMFCPAPESTLAEEIGANLATTINACGFDLVYLDGAEIGINNYGRSRGRAAVFSQIDHPVRIEASMWDAYSWTYHSVVGAWDYPYWGDKPYIDYHTLNAKNYKGALLPYQLGWWGVRGSGNDYAASFPDELEYLCAKAAGVGSTVSFEELSTVAKNGRQQECLEILGRWQQVAVDAVLQARLAAAGHDFHVETLPDGTLHVVEVDYAEHKVTGLGEESHAWDVDNAFGSQLPSLRIEALYGVGPYDNGTLSLTGTESDVSSTTVTKATHVAASVTWSTAQARPDEAGSMRFTATNSGTTRVGAWAKAARVYNAALDITGNDALGVWIYGDGQGEILNLQVFNAPGYSSALSEHYVTVDFIGWKYFELPFREPDVDRYFDYTWPYAYSSSLWRWTVDRAHVGGINVYYNNLPANGATVNCYLSLVKPLPIQKITLTNPTVTIGNATITFPTALESGQYWELDTLGIVRRYDQNGNLLGSVTSTGSVPLLAQGGNTVQFACTTTAGYNARANVTLGSYDRQSASWDASTLGDWGFDETSGTAVEDASSYLNQGRLSANPPTRVGGRYGNALEFNGTDTSVTIPASDSLNQLTGSFTVQLWFAYQGAGTPAKEHWTLLAKSQSVAASDDPFNLFVKANDRHIAARVGNGTTAYVLDSGLAIDDGRLHHAALVYDDTLKTYTLYVDGQLQATQATVADWTIARNNDDLTLGCHPAEGNFFRGIVDEVQLSSRPLAAAEILEQYANQPPAVAVTSPAEGATILAPTSLVLAAQVSDADGSIVRVAFYRDDTWIADGQSAGDGLYTATWSEVPESAFGAHTITVRAVDDQGAASVATYVEITVVAGPALVTPLASQAADLGLPATFRVSASGTPGLSYQWMCDGEPIAGATNAWYTTPPASATDEGRQYSVVVTNAYGSVTSNAATLHVNSGLVAWWKFDETVGTSAADASNSGYNGALLFGPAWTAGALDGGVSLDGLDDYVSVPSVAALKCTGGEFTLSTWFYVHPTETSGGYLLSKAWNGSGQYNYRIYLDSSRRVSFSLQPGIVGSQKTVAATTGVSASSWHHVAVTIDAEKWIRLYVDGSLMASTAHTITDWTPSLGDLNRSLAIGTLYPYTSWSGNASYSFEGKLDNVRVYTHALSAEAVARLALGPSVTDARITLSGATGSGGAFRAGDTVVVQWDNTEAGDANAGITGVAVDFGQFGGGAQPAVSTGDVWRASYTIVAGQIDARDRNVSVTVADNSRTVTTWDTSNATLDNQPPAVSVARISIGGATGSGGVYRAGDTVTVVWDNTPVGDDNQDIAAVAVDFSVFGGPAAIVAANDGQAWTAHYTIVAGEIDPAIAQVRVAASDDAGNANANTAPSANFDVDGNGSADALTDGILMLRYLFDPAGQWECFDALGNGARRIDRATIRSYLDRGTTGLLDVDGNGTADALTDGILILRYLFDPAGQWNFSDALGAGAARLDRESIKSHLDQHNPDLTPPSDVIAAIASSASEEIVSPAAEVTSVPADQGDLAFASVMETISGPVRSPTVVLSAAKDLVVRDASEKRRGTQHDTVSGCRAEVLSSNTSDGIAVPVTEIEVRDAIFRRWRRAASYYRASRLAALILAERSDWPLA